jgi:hypothetical protein
MEGSPAVTEGSCEYTEYVVADSRQGVVFQLWDWAWGLHFTVKNFYCCEIFQSASDLD